MLAFEKYFFFSVGLEFYNLNEADGMHNINKTGFKMMLRLRRSSHLLGTRIYSTGVKPPITPFPEDELKGDEKYQEINEFYSELFSAGDQNHLQTPGDELNEVNRELDDLFGASAPSQELTQVSHQQYHHPKLESLKDKIKSNSPKIFISNLTVPYKNLAIEHYIFQNTPVSDRKTFHAQRLLFYINSPCVVIGKNQNPWKETNFPLINDLKIPVLRRFSGGGTVVHDLGNVNYSFITSRSEFSRLKFGSIVVNELNKILEEERQIMQNERGDIINVKDKYKISGSAFKIARGKSYHHGTMLLNSKLDVLRSLLDRREQQRFIEFYCNSVESVPSHVANLGIEEDQFMSAVAEGFINEFTHDSEVIEIDEKDLDGEVLQIEEELRSWEHTFGQTPKFELRLHNEELQLDVKLKVEQGLVKAINASKGTEHFKHLEKVLYDGGVIRFVGSDVAGFIVDDKVSEFVGNTIDQTN